MHKNIVNIFLLILFLIFRKRIETFLSYSTFYSHPLRSYDNEHIHDPYGLIAQPSYVSYGFDDKSNYYPPSRYVGHGWGSYRIPYPRSTRVPFGMGTQTVPSYNIRNFM